MGRLCLLIVVAFANLQSTWGGVADDYLSAFLEMFPTRATQAGDHAFDGKLEDFSTEKLARWVQVNEVERDRLTKLLTTPDLPFDDRLDGDHLAGVTVRPHHGGLDPAGDPPRVTVPFLEHRAVVLEQPPIEFRS